MHTSTSPSTAELGPDWSRLNYWGIDDKLFVIDRHSGRWVLLPGEQRALLQLLPVASARLPAALELERDRLADALRSRGLGLPTEARDGLRMLLVKLTNACNYACDYCYDYETGDKRSVMSVDVGRAAIGQALELAPGPLQVVFHGGEPTLCLPLLQELVRFGQQRAAELGATVEFTGQTNLSRADSAFVEFSREHDIGWGVSLDGPPELNDRLRVLHDGGGTYARFARALAEFPEFVRGCPVMSTITAHNDTRLLEVARHFRDLGMASWSWSLFQPIGRGRQRKAGLGFRLDAVIASWDALFDAVIAGEFDGFRVNPVVEYLEAFVHGPVASMCLKEHCGAGRDLLSVSADGTVEACDCLDPQGCYTGLGSVHEDQPGSLLAARQSPLADLLRSRAVADNECGSCSWLSLCGGSCVAYADGLHDRWTPGCALSQNAYARISESMARSPRLAEYLEGCS